MCSHFRDAALHYKAQAGAARLRPRALLMGLTAAALLPACERETRDFTVPSNAAAIGPAATPATNTAVAHDERNAYALSAGKRLWTWYNCSGCHAQGGGGSGPALMDDQWIYGSEPAALYRSIAEGRPNGMPAFGTRLSNDQIWQLAAYVRSLAAIAPQDAAPNRDDALLTRTPESFMDPQAALVPLPPASGASR